MKQRFLVLLTFILLFPAACRQPGRATATPFVAHDDRSDEKAEPAMNPEPLPYRNPDLPVADRIEDLLQRMTLAEKLGQMTLVEKNSIRPGDIAARKIGALLSGGGGAPPANTAEAWLEMVSAFQEEALQTRLGIPLLYGVDAVHGHNNVKGAVIFPHNIGLGATRNPELVEEIGRATAAAVAATGIQWNYAPVLAVPQDARWGRFYEGYGEDPELVSALGTAFLMGLQGGPGATHLDEPLTILGTPKHFVADGGAMWGTSTLSGYTIDRGDARVDEETLRAVHLAPYEAAVEAGALSIMASFSSWNGVKMHGNHYLLTEVLKEELGFAGFVVSDWAAVDEVDGNYYEAVVQAINAGVDMNMVPDKYDLYLTALAAAVENGDVSEARIDDAVRRILRAKFALGLFDTPPAGPYGRPEQLSLIGSEPQRALARKAVQQSLVLLQNENGALPLARDTSLIFVAGEAADDIGLQCGGWTISWQGRAGNITPGTTILQAIEATAIPPATVHYNRFGRFEHVTNESGAPATADVGIAVVAETPYAEGVGDRADLSLSEAQIALIERVRRQSRQLVVILLSGRPLIITEQLGLADAWVAAWLPGTEGQGVADVLFGDAPFRGRLPTPWPRSMAQIGSASTPGEEPLFPFGYGLTAP